MWGVRSPASSPAGTRLRALGMAVPGVREVLFAFRDAVSPLRVPVPVQGHVHGNVMETSTGRYHRFTVRPMGGADEFIVEIERLPPSGDRYSGVANAEELRGIYDALEHVLVDPSQGHRVTLYSDPCPDADTRTVPVPAGAVIMKCRDTRSNLWCMTPNECGPAGYCKAGAWEDFARDGT